MNTISEKALKEWNHVTTQEEMIKWHSTYTPWLSQSLILKLVSYYEKEMRELTEKMKLKEQPEKQTSEDQIKKQTSEDDFNELNESIKKFIVFN